MSERQTPFVPGARVAVSGFASEWREQFVERSFKNGNFTLKGSKQQWRPNSHRGWGEDNHIYWTATQTGERGFQHSHLKLWDEVTDKEISEQVAETKRMYRLRRLQERFRSLRKGEVTDAMLDAIEAALPKAESVGTKATGANAHA